MQTVCSEQHFTFVVRSITVTTWKMISTGTDPWLFSYRHWQRSSFHWASAVSWLIPDLLHWVRFAVDTEPVYQMVQVRDEFIVIMKRLKLSPRVKEKPPTLRKKTTSRRRSTESVRRPDAQRRTQFVLQVHLKGSMWPKRRLDSLTSLYILIDQITGWWFPVSRLRCAKNGYTSRWYHLSCGEHFCNECFDHYYRR